MFASFGDQAVKQKEVKKQATPTIQSRGYIELDAVITLKTGTNEYEFHPRFLEFLARRLAIEDNAIVILSSKKELFEVSTLFNNTNLPLDKITIINDCVLNKIDDHLKIISDQESLLSPADYVYLWRKDIYFNKQERNISLNNTKNINLHIFSGVSFDYQNTRQIVEEKPDADPNPPSVLEQNKWPDRYLMMNPPPREDFAPSAPNLSSSNNHPFFVNSNPPVLPKDKTQTSDPAVVTFVMANSK